MSNSSSSARERVEPGIWKRTAADGRVRFEIAFKDSDERQRRQVVEGGLKAARVALASVKADRGRGIRVGPKPSLSFGEAADRWRPAQTARLRPATLKGYDYHLRALRLRWEASSLDAITVDDAARLVDEMRAAGMRAWTIRGRLTVASRVFDHARRRLGWEGENPVRELERSERPRGDARERRILSAAELDALLTGATDTYRLAFAVAAMTGARLGEVLGLRWRSVDLDSATITIDRQLNRQGQLAAPKTERSHRTIEIPTPLVDLLRSHKMQTPYSGDHDLVSTTRTGRAYDHRAVTVAFARAAERAGLAEPRPTFHDLRHSFASRFIAQGGDLVSLSAHLGHATPAVTASTYSHEFERASRAAERRARLDAMFGTGDSMVAARGSFMAALECKTAQQTKTKSNTKITRLQAKSDRAQRDASAKKR